MGNCEGFAGGGCVRVNLGIVSGGKPPRLEPVASDSGPERRNPCLGNLRVLAALDAADTHRTKAMSVDHQRHAAFEQPVDLRLK